MHLINCFRHFLFFMWPICFCGVKLFCIFTDCPVVSGASALLFPVVFPWVQFFLLSRRGPSPACPRCAPPDRKPHNCLQVVDYRLHLALLAHLDRTGAVLVRGNLPRRTSRRRLPNRKCPFYKNSPFSFFLCRPCGGVGIFSSVAVIAHSFRPEITLS